MGGKNEAILSNGQNKRYNHVTPERSLNCPCQCCIVGGNGIALGASNQGGDRQEVGRKEEAFTRMGQRLVEVAMVKEKSSQHPKGQQGEYDDVDDIDE